MLTTLIENSDIYKLEEMSWFVNSVSVQMKLMPPFPYLLLPDLLLSYVSRYMQSAMFRLRVCYSTILRKMLGVPPWNSAKSMFGCAYKCSLPEIISYSTYSLLARVLESTNVVLANIACIDVFVISEMKCHMKIFLFISCFHIATVFCTVFFVYGFSLK